MIKVVNTKTAYKDPFLEVILEDISVQKDKIIRNFSVVKKRSIVMIVAMTNKEQFLILNEYKFGSRKHMWTFPAGGLKKGEDPVISAKRELEEETGYSANTYEIVGVVYDYPSKDRHSVYIVKASGIRHKKNIHQKRLKFYLRN